MGVRFKIILVVLPLLLVSMVLLGTSSALSARGGITGLAIEFLGFKAEELETFSNNQWNLLVNNDLQDRPDLQRVTRQTIGTHAVEMIRSATELTLAVEGGEFLAFSSRPMEQTDIREEEWEVISRLYSERYRGWTELVIRGVPRVGYTFYFEPFSWQFLVTETHESFYGTVNEIVRRTVVITTAVLAVSAAMLIILAGFITRPLGRVVAAMDSIIADGDLSARVAVEFHDETGRLAHTFNIMMEQLDTSYRQVKEYARNAVLARKDEQKVRNIFQKYVPKDVIESIFDNPETMLVGDTREVAILFSDIRKFTTISEAYPPDKLVTVLNRYFTILVDIILDHNGIVDKYIGDAVMAFFGAPVRHDNDALDAVDAAVLVVEALDVFNREQQENQLPLFITGLGINYGEVTVGNIGTERKMDYTVIGDTVNLASRLEGLTKFYGQPLIISESVANRVGERYTCRRIDAVVVKGKTVPEHIFTTRRVLEDEERAAWEVHEEAMQRYFTGDFAGARGQFSEVLKMLPEDPVATMFIQRCTTLEANHPGDTWTGAFTMETK